MVEYGKIPRIQHVQVECLMYKSVENMYHRLKCPNTVYTTCAR